MPPRAAVRSLVTVRTGDAADPGLAPASVDVVLCRHVLWALPDPARRCAAGWRRSAPAAGSCSSRVTGRPARGSPRARCAEIVGESCASGRGATPARPAAVGPGDHRRALPRARPALTRDFEVMTWSERPADHLETSGGARTSRWLHPVPSRPADHLEPSRIARVAPPRRRPRLCSVASRTGVLTTEGVHRARARRRPRPDPVRPRRRRRPPRSGHDGRRRRRAHPERRRPGGAAGLPRARARRLARRGSHPTSSPSSGSSPTSTSPPS